MTFSGFYFARERYATSADLFDQLTKARGLNQRYPGYLTENFLRAETVFRDRFSPDRDHSRLVGHIVEVYSAKNVLWRPMGTPTKPYLVACAGNDPCLPDASFDIGKMVQEACGQERDFTPMVVEPRASHALGDGTVVRGKRLRVCPWEGSSTHRTLPHEFLRIDFDTSAFAKRGDFFYVFEIRKEAVVDPMNIRWFVVRPYVLIDGEPVGMQKPIVARPSFYVLAQGAGGGPGRFRRLVYTAT